jgi:hypothetical protein
MSLSVMAAIIPTGFHRLPTLEVLQKSVKSRETFDMVFAKSLGIPLNLQQGLTRKAQFGRIYAKTN